MKIALDLIDCGGSHYFKLDNGEKVRVSDHRASYTRDEGRACQLEFYTKKKGKLYSVKEQITGFCERNNVPVHRFNEIIKKFSTWDRYVKELRG